MAYTIRDAPDPELLISNEDLERLKKNKPETLEIALLQRKLLIRKLENTIASESSLSAELHEVNTLFYGYFDWETSKDVDGAVDLLKEVVDKNHEEDCKNACPYYKGHHTTIVCLKPRIVDFLKSIDE